MSNPITLRCPADAKRLDKLLVDLLGVSRNAAKTLIDEGRVQAGDLKLKASSAVAAGTELSIDLPHTTPTETGVSAQEIPLDILYEDEYLLAVNKPAGMVVHPASGHKQDTLVNALLYHIPTLAQLDPERPGIVHRLDKDTSGVMVVAKTEPAVQALQRQFKARTVEKIYRALIHGHPKITQGIIDVPIGRDPQNRQQMAPLKTGKPARTHYRVVQTFTHYSLLEIKLETGRTHQIRVHLAWFKHPIVGDTVYGLHKERLPLHRQFLHAGQLSLDHPLTGKRLTFTAPLPPDLTAILAQLESTSI